MMTGLDWGMGAGWLWMILGVVLIAGVIWALLTSLGGRDHPAVDGAAQILKTRFARGELTHAEYEQARRLLGI